MARSRTDPRRRRGAYAGLAILVAVLVVLPLFVKNAYIMHLLIMAMVYGVLGMSFSMMYAAGRLTLGASTFYVIGAYVSTIMTLKWGVPVWASLVLTTLVCTVLSLGLGAAILRGSGFGFGIVTLLLGMAVIAAAGQIDYLGGFSGFTGIPSPESIPLPGGAVIEFTGKAPYYYLALFLALIVGACFIALYSSRIGRDWKAIKLSPELAQSLGINLYRRRLLAFVVSSMAVGLFGSFYVHYNHLIEPTSFGGFFSINIQLYSVLGGLEYYILGPVVGGAIMTFLPEYFRVFEDYNTIITGLLLIVVILFFRGGVIGIFKSVSSRIWPGRQETVSVIQSGSGEVTAASDEGVPGEETT